MTDFEELHRWSVEQELRDPPAAASMAALRRKVDALRENAKLVTIEPRLVSMSNYYPSQLAGLSCYERFHPSYVNALRSFGQ